MSATWKETGKLRSSLLCIALMVELAWNIANESVETEDTHWANAGGQQTDWLADIKSDGACNWSPGFPDNSLLKF